MVFAGALVGIKPFLGKRKENLPPIKKPSTILWIPTMLLSSLSLLFGFFPSLLDGAIVTPYLNQIQVATHPLKIWHGFNTVLILSIFTLLAGTLFFFIWKKKHSLEQWIKKLEFISPKSLFKYLVLFFEGISKLYTTTLQNGYLRNYVLVLVLSFTSVLIYHTFTSPLNFIDFNNLLTIGINDIAIVSMMFFAILFTVFSRSRLAAIAGLGIVGYAMCFIFVFYSAPDLAMTQFTIDTLTVILFVLVLYRLPKYLRLSNTKFRIRDGILALALGSMVTLLVLEVMNESPLKSTSEFYTENAYLLAKGKNIVNVILVDFRGFDTFVEVIVLAIAAIGVFGLLKLHIKRK
jgi:multicomponent Na+:H+ antiporter subunit A